ncbi:MAG: hypothetical protein ACRCUL_10140 [Plesiomonas sp.]
MWPRNRVFQLLFIGFAVFILSRLLDGCEIRRNFTHIAGQNQQQSGMIAYSYRQDSARMAVLKRTADSLKQQNESLLDGNAALMYYAQTSDSLLRMQTDSTRRAKEENRYIQLRQQADNKSIQQMFWVLSNGLNDLRQVVDSLDAKGKTAAEQEAKLTLKLADSTKTAQEIKQVVLAQIKDTVSNTSELSPTKKVVGSKAKKSATHHSSINNKKRERQSKRRTRQARRRTLLKSGV